MNRKKNEAETRAEDIDPVLAAKGWGRVAGSRIAREYVIAPGRLIGGGKRAKAKVADYVLYHRNTRLGVIEAKPWDNPMTEGVGQAKDYAEKLKVRFTYSSNGRGFYGIDMATGLEGVVSDFPTPDELWNATYPNARYWGERFADVSPVPERSGFERRYYQETAVERILQAVADGKTRILVTMATGTGKTEVSCQTIWKLWKSKWNLSGKPTRAPRVLYLSDRNILADQGYLEFAGSAFPEDSMVRITPGDIKKKGHVPTNAHIFHTIFQTFMRGPNTNGTPTFYYGEYPPDFFDFIIIDECHRGGANDESTWRSILEHFSVAVQLGMTATPKRKDNVDTYSYFGEPVFTYSLKEGINEGFLSPFKIKKIATTIDEYVFQPGHILLEGEIQKGHIYTEAEFNKKIVIEAREQKRLELFLAASNPADQTVVWCRDQEHALLIRDLINQLSPSKNPNYCVRVTADEGEIGEQFLRNFQANQKGSPTVLTTSQKLSTGVDARNIRNIVLLRPVNSMIEFKQIVGRGTRLYQGKDYFTIYDFVGAHKHFKDPEWDGEPMQVETMGAGRERSPEPVTDLPEDEAAASPRKIRVRLANGEERNIDSMMATMYYGSDGSPVSAIQLLENLFGTLPELFQNEKELRRLWSFPDTRKDLIDGLAERGFGSEALEAMQQLAEAEDSDLFDVLAYVAYELPPVSRSDRAENAKVFLSKRYNDREEEFLNFVLDQYVKVGVNELALDKLVPLLKLRYGTISDATKDLGSNINMIFVGFQQYLYQIGRPLSLSPSP